MSRHAPATQGREQTATGLRILVPLDDSPAAQRALLYAGALAGATQGRIKLFRATDLEAEAGFNSLAHHAQHLREAGIAVEWTVLEGVDAGTAVLDTAHVWRPELIAMAT